LGPRWLYPGMTLSPRKKISSLGALFALALLAACEPPAVQDDDEATIDENLDALHGLPGGTFIPQNNDVVRAVYNAGMKKWIRWVSALPWSTGPVDDPTGASCAQGQSGPVWLLAGTSGGPTTRSCTIPKHKMLFFPLINHWVVPPHESVDTPEEYAEYLEFVDYWYPANRAETCTLTLIVDGVEVEPDFATLELAAYTEERDPYTVFLNADNFGPPEFFPEGIYPHVTSDGHYALLTPFAPGTTHTVELGGSQCDATGTWFETSVVYNLTIEN
jgi:hypothetical protein